MPRWSIHIKWSRKMGIPDDIAEDVNRIIDARRLEDYPEDFAEYMYRIEFPQPKGRKPFLLADFLVIFGTHDFRKIKKEVFPYFRRKGEVYVRAWYLHHILDYLVKLRGWMENTDEDTKECIDKYRRNKAVTLLGTEKQLTKVMNFLKGNTQELQKDLDLPR
jgi:hypothetical protein